MSGITSESDYCSRCGAFGPGQRRWMFYKFGIEREFHCLRCMRIMRIYAWIGFSILFVIVAGLSAATIWLSRH